MEPIRLLVSDLDGTLLRDDKTLSPYTQKTLRRCQEKGVLFFPATARPPRTLEALFRGVPYDGAMCHNGGIILQGSAILWEKGIAPAIRDSVIQKIFDQWPNARLSAEIGGTLYANLDASQLWPGTIYTYSTMRDLPARPTEKLLVNVPSHREAEVLRQLLPESVCLQISEGTLAMIQPQGVDKGRALLGLCENLGISPQAAVGFGDDLNDIPLLQACGWGVAVSNALPEVKAAAQEVCLSNQKDGVAHWLEEHIL